MRELYLLAHGRERAEWGRTASLLAHVVRMFGGGDCQPHQFVPDWLQDELPGPRVKSEAAKERESRHGFALLDRFFGG